MEEEEGRKGLCPARQYELPPLLLSSHVANYGRMSGWRRVREGVLAVTDEHDGSNELSLCFYWQRYLFIGCALHIHMICYKVSIQITLILR